MTETPIVKTEYIFKGEAGIEINDTIYQGSPFPLIGHSYRFTLEPKTKFWRFGLRFSKTEEILFYSDSRYRNEEMKDIQVVAGVMSAPTNEWHTPNRLELGHYHQFPMHYDKNPLQRSESYIELGVITLIMQFDPVTTELAIFCEGDGIESTEDYLIIKDYKYFQIFAWADYISYEVKCTIEDKSLEEFISFQFNDIIFRQGDLFLDVVIDNSDMIVLPCSDTGSASDTILKTARNFEIPAPQSFALGRFVLHDITHLNKYWGWAYSVRRSASSTLSAIKNIVDSILIESNKYNIRRVSLPLLGTGEGKLDFKEVANLYNDILSSTETNVEFIVIIDNPKRFNALFEYFKNRGAVKLVEEADSRIPVRFKGSKNIKPVFDVQEIALEVGAVIDNIPESDNEGVIGIFGKWGRGKTYFIDKLWENYKNNKGYKRVDFHAWKYQDTPALWGYLYEQFSNVFYSGNSIKKLIRTLVANGYRIGLSALFFFLLLFSISYYITFRIGFWDKAVWLFSGGFSILIGGLLLYYRYGRTAKSLYNKYTKRASFVNLLGVQAEVQKELIQLLNVWSKLYGLKRVFLFVEDIDRCSEKKIISIIDSLRVMLEDPAISKRVIVLAAIDESILERAIRKKYEDLIVDEAIMKKSVIEYLDKLFISGIKLGTLSRRERDDFLEAISTDERDSFIIKDFDHDLIIFDKNLGEKKSTILNTVEQVIKTSIVEEQSKDSEVIVQNKEDNREDSSSRNVQKPSVRKISEIEYELLRNYLIQNDELNPRQIRILYLRYLIAKNLLARRYEGMGKQNYWSSSSNCGILIKLLVGYSKLGGREKLTSDKIDALHSTTPKKRIGLLDEVIDTLHYREVLKVLDIVITY